MAYCWKCGKPLPEGAKFCIYCGAEVRIVESEPEEAPERITEEKPVDTRGLYYNPKPVEDNSSQKTETTPVKARKTVKKKETQGLYYEATADKIADVPEETETKPVKARKTTRKKEVRTDIVEEKPVKRNRQTETKAQKARREKEEREAIKEARKAEKAEKKAARKARKQEKKKKKKRSFLGRIFRFIRNLFILSICSSLIIVALFHYGILTEDFDVITAFWKVVNKVEDLMVSYDEPADELNNDDPGLITIRYSDRELKNARSDQTEVSPENRVVTVGDLSVDMGYGNLAGNDTLIVRDLGRKDDDGMAVALHCYDLSLKSGTDQFPGLVRITIPLDLGDKEYLDGMVYFNEETKQWEDLYYDVSADGKTAIAYMDHFTKVSPKIGKMTAEMFDAALAANSAKKHSSEFIKSKDGDTAIPANLFVEAWNKYRQTRDTDYVYFRAYPTMRNVALHNDTLRELFSLNGRDVYGTPESIAAAINKLQNAIDAQNLDWPSRMLGIGDASMGAVNDFTVLNGLLSTGGKVFSETAGKMIGGLNILITGIKVFSEIEAGKSVEQAFSDNQLSIIGAGVTALGLVAGTVAGLATWPLTLLGIGLCASSLAIDVYKYTEGLDELPMQEQAYFAYYNYIANDKTKIPDRARIGFDKENFKCKMEVPKGVALDEKDGSYKRIVSHVKEYGLNEEWVWNSMFRLIYKNCEKEPNKIEDYINDLMYKYADAYWNLSKQDRDNWTYQWMHDKGYSEEEIQYVLDQVVLNSDIETWRKDKMNQLLMEFYPIIKEMVKLYTTKAFTAFKKEIQKEFLNPLNYMIYFHVEDQTLEKGQKFKDSIYAQDYRNIVYNKDTYFKNSVFSEKEHITEYYHYMKNELPIYADMVVPMRFVGVEYPLFYPYQVVWDTHKLEMDKVTRMDRYPHEPEYLPWYDVNQKSDDLVFACTVYHYIQMGQPTRMLFKDVTSIETWEDVQKYYDDPGIEVSFNIPKFNKKGQSHVRIKVTGDGELSQLNGYWEGPWLGSSKQWYFFEVNTDNKRIYIEDTLGLPTESFTIRRYKYDRKTKTLKFIIGWGKGEKATMEFKITGKDTMVLYIEYNGDNTSMEFVRSTRERFDDWGNRQKFNLPDPSSVIPPGEEL